jgi:predicted secreted protein
MPDKIGLIKENTQDKRNRKLIFVSHCMLNQNACVNGISSEPAMITPLIKMLMENDVAIYQMPCPEVSYIGQARWGQVKEMYNTPMFRRHCRKIAKQARLFHAIFSLLCNSKPS